MKKIIKLTESDLVNIVKKVLLKEDEPELPQVANVPINKIAVVQQALIDAGYDVGPEGVDGKFGKNTRAAVIKYQRDNGIKQTGNVGPITGGKLGVPPLTSGIPATTKKPTTTGTKKPTKTGTKKPTTSGTKKPTTAGTKKPTTAGTTGTKKPFSMDDFRKSEYQRYRDDMANRSDYLGKGGAFERSLYGGKSKEDYIKMQEFLKKFPQSKKSSLPLHIRALMDYLNGRETPFTAADLTRDEQKFLKNVVLPNAKKGLTYPLWKDIGAGNLPTSMTVSGSEKEKKKLADKGEEGSLIKPELAGQFMYTLGEISPPNIKVAPDKSTVTVFDRYDFNTQGKTKEDLMKSFVDQVGSWWKGDSTFYSVIRNAVAFKESGGYKGYPVNITV